jgi:hypothetical protein
MKIELRLKLHWVGDSGGQKIVFYTLRDALWCAKKDSKRWIPWSGWAGARTEDLD